jgi:dephospho-CoA kinase
MRKIILVVGLPGSGKSMVSNFIRDKFNADVFLSGDIIRDEIKRRGLRYTPENDAKIAHWFHTGGRENIVIARLWKIMGKSKKNLMVIDGLRSEKQMGCLEKTAKIRPVIIAIVSPQDVRVRRELRRGRFGKSESVAYVKYRDRLEKGHGIMGLMHMADYKINNSRLSVRQTKSRTYKIIKEILAN